jgi:CBS domain-containing protein
MPSAFNFSASPFDSLSPDEQRIVRNSVDIAYFRSGETILGVGIRPTHLFVVIKGWSINTKATKSSIRTASMIASTAGP